MFDDRPQVRTAHEPKLPRCEAEQDGYRCMLDHGHDEAHGSLHAACTRPGESGTVERWVATW